MRKAIRNLHLYAKNENDIQQFNSTNISPMTDKNHKKPNFCINNYVDKRNQKQINRPEAVYPEILIFIDFSLPR